MQACEARHGKDKCKFFSTGIATTGGKNKTKQSNTSKVHIPTVIYISFCNPQQQIGEQNGLVISSHNTQPSLMLVDHYIVHYTIWSCTLTKICLLAMGETLA
jgi:hypothetical protein